MTDPILRASRHAFPTLAATALFVTQAHAQPNPIVPTNPPPPDAAKAPSTPTNPAPAPAEPNPLDAPNPAEAPTPKAAPSASPPPAPAYVFVPPHSKPTSSGQVAEPPAAESESAPDDGLMGTHRDHLLATVGVRVGYIPNAGFDPFSTDDALAQFSLGVGSTVYGDDDISIATLLYYDVGGSTAEARGGEASLSTHRITFAGEGRYHFFRRLYVFGRVAPGALRWDASLEDGSIGYTRNAGNWMFALDLSAGTTFEFAGEARGKSSRPRAWLSAEAGYGWTTSSEVTFVTDEDQGPARVEPLAFNDLALRGGFFRISANVTY